MERWACWGGAWRKQLLAAGDWQAPAAAGRQLCQGLRTQQVAGPTGLGLRATASEMALELR